MRWRKVEGPTRVQDRRRRRGAVAGGAAGGIGILGLLAVLLFGGGGGGFNVEDVFGQLSTQQAPAGQDLQSAPDPDAELVDFMEFLDVDIEQTWTEIFAAAGQTYQPVNAFVIFEGRTDSACGGATAAVGPHYCSLDRSVYLDLGFFTTLQNQFGATGDFAQAYVIAHEYAHHVQNVVGTMPQVQQLQGTASIEDRNELSVRQELQADCYAGVWAHSAAGNLEPGDIEEALGAAAAVGDDRIQQATQGYVNPHTFTHGTSEQRVKWFNRGFESGDPGRCDTFSGGI